MRFCAWLVLVAACGGGGGGGGPSDGVPARDDGAASVDGSRGGIDSAALAIDAPPTLADWPTAATTGVPAGTALTPSGSVVVTTDGAVIEALDVTGTITVRATGVTIRRTRVTHDDTAITIDDGASATIEDVTLIGTSAHGLDGAVQASGALTMWRVHVQGFGEGVDVYGVGGLIQDCLFDDMANADGELMDGIEAWDAHHLVIRHNVLEMPGGNSVIKLPLDVPAPGGDDVLIEHNLVAGGGWAVYGGHDTESGNTLYTNVRFVDNHFSTKFEPRCGYYGPAAFVEPGLSSGNVWHESGEALDL